MLQIRHAVIPAFVESLRGSRRAGRTWTEWLAHATPAGTRIWIHGASVGEALVARPVVARLRARLPEGLTTVHTFTSPSLTRWPGSIGADRSDYLPLPPGVNDMLRSYQPNLILYPRADLWPTLVASAARAHVPQIVIGGSISPTSRRIRWPARLFYRRMIKHLTAVCTTGPAETAEWERLGASPGTVHVTGDPRDDDVLDGRPVTDALDPLVRWAADRFVLVAGSVEPRDWDHLESVLACVPDRIATLLVPHEPGTAFCERVAHAAAARHLPATIWAPGDLTPRAEVRVVVVNAVGVLRELYGLGKVAYVGGGFGRSGVHSVAEAAAWGIPILVGPNGVHDREAARFVRCQGGDIVADANGICARLAAYLEDETNRCLKGENARACLNAGAAERTVDVIVAAMFGGLITPDRSAERFPGT